MRHRPCPILIAIVAAAGPAAAADQATPTASPTIDDLAFLAGGWLAHLDGDRLEEHYTPPRDGSIVGLFRWSDGGGTRMTEHIVIEQHEDAVRLYLRHFHPHAVAWEQEESGGPMVYTLQETDAGRAVFVDPARLFPRRIVYERVAPDRLIARLEGRRDTGMPREMEFPFRSISMTTSTESLTEAGLSMGYNGGLTIAFHCKDLDKSIDWYQNVLGFKLAYHLQEMGWCELSTSVGGVNVGLSQVEQVKPGGPTPTFGVKDIEHARGLLEDKNVRFDGDTIEIPDMVKLATFFDPDGNSLMLYQSLSDQIP